MKCSYWRDHFRYKSLQPRYQCRGTMCWSKRRLLVTQSQDAEAAHLIPCSHSYARPDMVVPGKGRRRASTTLIALSMWEDSCVYQNSTCSLHMLLISLPSEILANTNCCCMGHTFSQMKETLTSLYPPNQSNNISVYNLILLYTIVLNAVSRKSISMLTPYIDIKL